MYRNKTVSKCAKSFPTLAVFRSFKVKQNNSHIVKKEHDPELI